METALRKMTELGQTAQKFFKSGRNMRWIMIACCLIPLAAIFILPAVGVNLGNSLWILMIIICPLSHLLMMRGMHDHDRMEKRGDSKPGDVRPVESDDRVGGQFPILDRDKSNSSVELLVKKKDHKSLRQSS